MRALHVREVAKRLGESLITMRRWHLASGLTTVTAFLLSGAYMMFVLDLGALEPERRLLFISRHIYMLGPGLVHCVLAAYLEPVGSDRVRRLQWAGTVLLLITSVLLVTAFLTEAVAGRGRTDVSALGLFGFWAGAMLHATAPWVGRRLER